jgi:hypothetical protein
VDRVDDIFNRVRRLIDAVRIEKFGGVGIDLVMDQDIRGNNGASRLHRFYAREIESLAEARTNRRPRVLGQLSFDRIIDRAKREYRRQYGPAHGLMKVMASIADGDPVGVSVNVYTYCLANGPQSYLVPAVRNEAGDANENFRYGGSRKRFRRGGIANALVKHQ